MNLQLLGCNNNLFSRRVWKTVIHLEVGSSESRDLHSQKPASPTDKRVSHIQYFSSFPLQNVRLQALLSKAWRLKIRRQKTGVFLSLFHGKNFKITNLFRIFAFGAVRKQLYC